jgi:membrane-associated protein
VKGLDSAPVASLVVDAAEKARAVGDTLAFNPLNAKDWITAFGLIGVWAILFAETGLLIGFFLPGDSLLFLAGVAASSVGERIVGEPMSLAGLLVGGPICAIAGAQLGHHLGARVGRVFFERPDSKLFRKEHVEKAEYYFEKFGPAKAVVLARFIPIVRTFLNPVAGVLEMPAKRFLLWNVIGGVVWTDGLIMAGYLLGDHIPVQVVDRYLIPTVGVIILISAVPVLVEIVRSRRKLARERNSRGQGDG